MDIFIEIMMREGLELKQINRIFGVMGNSLFPLSECVKGTRIAVTLNYGAQAAAEPIRAAVLNKAVDVVHRQVIETLRIVKDVIDERDYSTPIIDEA